MTADIAWGRAREAAHTAGLGIRLGHDAVGLADAVGRVAAADAYALADLPGYSSSAMDGWAVAGEEPWVLGDPVLAGHPAPVLPLQPGTARQVATGAPIPDGTAGILRMEHGIVDAPAGTGAPGPAVRRATLRRGPSARPGEPAPGEHIRRVGEEAHAGEVLVTAGMRLTPPRIALLAAAGHDVVDVRARPRVSLVVLGDEVVRAGVAPSGSVRDVFGPALPAVIRDLGAEPMGPGYVADSADDTAAALAAGDCDVVVLTGGSSRGTADHARSALAAHRGSILVDGIAMRPGHPAMLARLPGGRLVLCLPGNPTAGLMAFLTLGVPLIEGLLGRPLSPLTTAVTAVDLADPGPTTRLVAYTALADGLAQPAPRQSPGMLRGLADADGVLVVSSAGFRAGDAVPAIRLGW